MVDTWSPTRVVAAAAMALTVLVLVAVLLTRDSGGAPAAKGQSRAAAGGSDAAGATGGSGSQSTTGGSGDSSSSATVTTAPKPLPLDASVENTKGLEAGDEVVVNVTAADGSLIYGVEMRQCRAGTVVNNDGDMLPSVTGQCASRPLSPNADSYKIVPSEGARTSVRATYRVGTGTDTFPLDDGGSASVTCDAKHPCVLAVKYQIPGGFGFRTYPITFS